MHPNQRLPLEVSDSRRKIATLYLRGMTQALIAKEIGKSQPFVCQEINAVRQLWLDSALQDFDARKAEELARIDELEREYWAAWRESKSQREKTITMKRDGNGGYSQAGIQRENQYGDPRFLQGVERCIQERCKIFGLYAPTQISINELDSLLARELARIAGVDEGTAPGAAAEDTDPEVTVN